MILRRITWGLLGDYFETTWRLFGDFLETTLGPLGDYLGTTPSTTPITAVLHASLMLFLDAIVSPSTYPCQSVGGFGDGHRTSELASFTFIVGYLY